ncbi:DddA-like double-stranded DNA deaminase toxin [Micromonospora tarensis]|uniref:DddA-like double-stranded DNA deaminase toxin n=1 Tax=Micromonospora tarensis TaxID=2806100 RepID=UPI0038991978
MDHAEAQAAAVLRRRGGPQGAVLVLNHTPCDDPIDLWSARRSSPRSCRREPA